MKKVARISMRPVIPKGKVIDERAVLDAIEETLRSITGPKLQKDFKKTVNTWEHKPKFAKTFAELPNQMMIKVYPTGRYKDQYYYVHEGTKARLIVPRVAGGVLKFQPGYIPSSRKGVISSGRASRFGNAVFATKVRRHPGIEARKFSDTIAKKQQPIFAKDINRAIARAVD